MFQVTDLLGKHSDLMDEFNDFLERCENIGNCFSDFLLNVVVGIIIFSHTLRMCLAYFFCRWIPGWCHE